jgi:hypothetical protein
VAASTGTCSNTATATPAAGVTDLVPANNSATDLDHVTALADFVFADGFESGSTTGWSNAVGEMRLRVEALAQPGANLWAAFSIDGEQVRRLMPAGGVVFAGLADDDSTVFTIEVRHRGQELELRATVRLADENVLSTPWTLCGAELGWIEVDWRRAIAGLGDGLLIVRVNGVTCVELLGLDNQWAEIHAVGLVEIDGQVVVTKQG